MPRPENPTPDRLSQAKTNASPRKIDDAPFCWQSKAALWRIREAFHESTFLDQAHAVYLTLCELASDEQSATFDATRRKIAERSGVSIRRVSEILARFKALNLLNWKQNFLAGSKELAPSTYMLMSCRPCTRLGTDKFSVNCTVNKQSSKESPEKSPSIRGSRPPVSGNVQSWQSAKDRERLQRQIREERERTNPDKDIIAGLRSELATINAELRRRGQSASQKVTAADDAPRRNDRNAGTYNAECVNQPVPDLDATNARRQARAAQEAWTTQVKPEKSEQPKTFNIWELPEEKRAAMLKQLRDAIEP